MTDAAARILLVEDDGLIRSSITASLRGAGYAVQELADGTDAVAAATAFRPDLALLDVMLPGADGTAVARRLRRWGDVGVIFVTARDAVTDRLTGFAAGGDDYLVKPFAIEELLARVGAVLRRRGFAPAAIDLGPVLIDEHAGAVLVEGGPVEVTATEFRLLVFLARHRGRVLSKTQILTQVWGYDDYDPNLVEVHISALRRKLGDRGGALLRTVRGLGYVLEAAA